MWISISRRPSSSSNELRWVIAKFTDMVGLTPEKVLNGSFKYFLVDPQAEESRIDFNAVTKLTAY
jgi:hypothetical protein